MSVNKGNNKIDKDYMAITEEDKMLKQEIEFLVQTLESTNFIEQLNALETLKRMIISATTSMTSVPKPLKYLREQYCKVKSCYENIFDIKTKKSCADIISVIGVVMTDKEEFLNDTLQYRFLGLCDDVDVWGHEYVRHLTNQIVTVWVNKDLANDNTVDCNEENFSESSDSLKVRCLALVHKIIPYFMKHNAAIEAIDLCIELELLNLLSMYASPSNYDRICLYMMKTVLYLSDPDNRKLLEAAAKIYEQFGDFGQAMKCALRLNDADYALKLLEKAKTESLQKQLAFLLARQQYNVPYENLVNTNMGGLVEITSNARLSEYFHVLARELDIMDPKLPEDIYKSHLEPSRPTLGLKNVDSARNNLASSYVNGLVNCGFGKDKLIMEDESGMKWVYKNQECGMMSTIGTLGWVFQWDVDGGLSCIDKYLYSDDDYIKAGGLLACGVVNARVKNECDPALALLGEYVTNSKKVLSRASIVGLGVAYAGTRKPECLAILQPVILDMSSEKFELSCLAALSSGMIAVSSLDGELTTIIIQTMMERSEEQMSHPFAKFMVLGLALTCFGRQGQVDVILASLEALQEPLRSMAHLMCDICAYAGSGSVLKVQQLLHILSEKTDEKKPAKKNEDESDNQFDYLAHQGLAVLGIGLISMGEPIGQEMGFRVLGRLLRFGNVGIKRAVPLALALMWSSDPQMRVLDTLGKFSHDSDQELAFTAILSMGLVGAGTNNARLAAMLRQLALFHSQEPRCIFGVRLAQGLLHLGKGTLTISPHHQDRFITNSVAVGGLLTLLVSCLDIKNTFMNSHDYLLFYLTSAFQPRLLMTFDESLHPLPVTVRVGQAVDTVGQAGRPKTITGFQTHTTPVLLAAGERVELSTEQYVPISELPLEGFVILKKNPNWEES